MKYLKIAGGLVLSLALLMNVAFLFPAYNRLRVYQNKDHYLKTIFRVEGAKYVPPQGDSPEAYWLTGKISGKEERFVPNFPKHFMPHNKGDIQTQYPIGTKIDVLYSPSETTTIMQGETLRVRPYDSESWANEQKFPYGALLAFTFPVLLLIAIYFTTRSLFTMWQWRTYSNISC